MFSIYKSEDILLTILRATVCLVNTKYVYGFPNIGEGI